MAILTHEGTRSTIHIISLKWMNVFLQISENGEKRSLLQTNNEILNIKLIIKVTRKDQDKSCSKREILFLRRRVLMKKERRCTSFHLLLFSFLDLHHENGKRENHNDSSQLVRVSSSSLSTTPLLPFNVFAVKEKSERRHINHSGNSFTDTKARW